MNLLRIKFLHTTDFKKWQVDSLYKNCRGFRRTVCIMKTKTHNILGCYSPQQWSDTGGPLSSSEVTNGNTFAFYFENDVLKVCRVRPKEKSFIMSSFYTPICLYGNEQHTNTLSIASDRSSKNPDFARIRLDTHHGYPDLPEFQDYQKNLHFGFGNGPHFKTVLMEVYGLQ